MSGIRVRATAAALLALMASPRVAVMAAGASAVRITSLANGERVSGNVRISTKTRRSVAWVNIFIDGQYLGSSPPSVFQWDSTAVSNGSHTIRADARNARRLLGTASAIVDVENGAGFSSSTSTPNPSDPQATPTPAPSVSSSEPVAITAPAAGTTVSGTVMASAEVAPSVAWVNFYLDSTFVASGSPPNASGSVDTTITVNGSHTIWARAFDSSGNEIGSDSVSLMIANDASASADPSSGYYATLPPHAALPSESECASEVLSRSGSEAIARNETYNQTVPTSSELASFYQQPLWNGEAPASDFSNVDGNFTGTTDQIIRWAACKWGLDENAMRAEAWSETFWVQDTPADRRTDPALCQTPNWNGWDGAECWQSYGIFQSKVFDFNIWPETHDSTAFNADFRAAYLRACMNGDISYMRRRTPNAGYPSYTNANTDQMFWGCMGEWASGGWYDAGAIDYITSVKSLTVSAPWPH